MSGPRLDVLIVGTGRLGASLALALARDRGVRVTVTGRRPAAVRRVAKLSPGIATAPLSKAIAAARILILAIPDRMLAPLCRELAGRRASWRGAVVLHAAGAYGPEVLLALARRGASTGLLHPMAALGASGARALRGASARIDGDRRAKAAAARIAAAAGLRPLRAPALTTAAARGAYHAAASLASNDVLALLEIAERLLRRCGISGPDARGALLALARGVLDQFEAGGPAGALTGPASRGDLPTLRRQLSLLARVDRDAEAAHRALSRRLAQVAVASGRLDRVAAAALRAGLRRGRSKRSAV